MYTGTLPEADGDDQQVVTGSHASGSMSRSNKQPPVPAGGVLSAWDWRDHGADAIRTVTILTSCSDEPKLFAGGRRSTGPAKRCRPGCCREPDTIRARGARHCSDPTTAAAAVVTRTTRSNTHHFFLRKGLYPAFVLAKARKFNSIRVQARPPNPWPHGLNTETSLDLRRLKAH
jgi:hypothetical protein